MSHRFEFRLTAGAVIEKDGKILIVKEKSFKKDLQGQTVITQPTGHIEEGESIIKGMIREVLEETGYTVQPTALIGIYLNRFNKNSVVRFSFTADLINESRTNILDKDVIEAIWLPVQEIKNLASKYRCGSTKETFDDYFSGQRYPLEILHFFDKRKI